MSGCVTMANSSCRKGIGETDCKNEYMNMHVHYLCFVLSRICLLMYLREKNKQSCMDYEFKR